MSELKKHTLKVRVTELENRLNNLQVLVANIASNQDEIVEAITTNEVAKVDEFDMSGFSEEEQWKAVEGVNDELTLNYKRQDRKDCCDDEDCESKVCLVNKCES